VDPTTPTPVVDVPEDVRRVNSDELATLPKAIELTTPPGQPGVRGEGHHGECVLSSGQAIGEPSQIVNSSLRKHKCGDPADISLLVTVRSLRF
jgi:hypothetical protein